MSHARRAGSGARSARGCIRPRSPAHPGGGGASAARGCTDDSIDPGRPDRRISAIVNSQATSLVVGVDGTDRSRHALALAAHLADSDQRVLLTHVHPYGRLANLLSGGQYEVLVRDVADATFAAVQETLGGLIAEETGASIIVVGSSHRSGLDRVLAGSVTESVLTVRLSPSPSLRAITAAPTAPCEPSDAATTAPRNHSWHSPGPPTSHAATAPTCSRSRCIPRSHSVACRPAAHSAIDQPTMRSVRRSSSS
jgi:hypothetical protein